MEWNIKVLFVVVIICSFNEPTIQEDQCFADGCLCYDDFFFAVFKLVLPPIILELYNERSNDLESFDADGMEGTVADKMASFGVDDLIHLIADDDQRQPIEERRSFIDHGTICKDAFLDLGKKMLEYCRTLKRIERVPTIDDLRLNFEQEFDINSNNLFNQH